MKRCRLNTNNFMDCTNDLLSKSNLLMTEGAVRKVEETWGGLYKLGSQESNIPEENIAKTLGLVKGNTIRDRNIGRDILAAIKGVIGGEVSEYSKLLAESREEA